MPGSRCTIPGWRLGDGFGGVIACCMTAAFTKAIASPIVLNGCALATVIETSPGPEILSASGQVTGSGSQPVEGSTQASKKGPPSTCKHSGGHGGLHWADGPGDVASVMHKNASTLANSKRRKMSNEHFCKESMF